MSADDLLGATSRAIPGLRALRTSIRAAHVLATAAFYGGHVYGVSPERLGPALAAVLGTGFVFALLEISRAPVWLVQTRGVAVYVKIALMVWAAAAPTIRIPLLTLALVIGVVVSHMPGRYRYYSLLHRRAVGHDDKG
jgi:hypothetical protein